MKAARIVEVPASDIRPGDTLIRVGAETDWGIHTWVVARSGKKWSSEANPG